MSQAIHNRPSEVIYQIYPSSFCDANGDGCGDLKGITSRLDYVKSLGVDAVWISPFFLSPPGKDGDGGYAIKNYREIDPRFGTMEDFKTLLSEAHKRGLRIYTDFVLCHTASEHEWFEKSRRREPGYENHYVWHRGKENGNGHPDVPNNWLSCFGGPAWHQDPVRGEYYLRHFNTSQPALNLNEPHVQDAILQEMRFWLDAGVDGLRLDALPFANHDREFRDNRWIDHGMNQPRQERGDWGGETPQWNWQMFDRSMCQDSTVDLVARIRQMLDEYKEWPADYPPQQRHGAYSKTGLGEVIAGRVGGSCSTDIARDYTRPDVGLHSCYTESLIGFEEYPSAEKMRTMLRDNLEKAPDGGFCINASNHDFARAATRMTNKAPQELQNDIIRQLMALNMSLPGSFCMYQGEELGLPQARLQEENNGEHAFDIALHQRKDLVAIQCRDGARTPMPWDHKAKHAGFTTAEEAYLPVPQSHLPRAVDLQEQERGSMLNFTRKLIRERKENPALSQGVTQLLNTKDSTVAFVRRYAKGDQKQTVLCVYNMSQQELKFKPAEYLDAQTLKELDLEQDSVIHLDPYGFNRTGLRGHQHERTDTRPKIRRVSGGHQQTRIFAADMLIADHIMGKHLNERVQQVLPCKPDDRSYIEDESMHHRLMNINGAPHVTLGGSTGLSLWTLKKLHPDSKISFLGLAGDDHCGQAAKSSLRDAGIELIADEKLAGLDLKTAVSHVVAQGDGHYSMHTYGGNAIGALKKLRDENPNLIHDAIGKCDIVYLPGSIMKKFGKDFTDEILRERWLNHKELVVSLPPHAEFGPDDPEYFRRLISSANVTIGSDVEFCRLFLPAEECKRPVTDEKMEIIKRDIRKELKKKVLPNSTIPCSKYGQAVLITCGDKPAWLVTADRDPIPILPLDVPEKHNFLGVGDAVTAGFLAGYLGGHSHEVSANDAMLMAAAKLQQPEDLPYVKDPRSAMAQLMKSPAVRERPVYQAQRSSFAVEA